MPCQEGAYLTCSQCVKAVRRDSTGEVITVHVSETVEIQIENTLLLFFLGFELQVCLSL